MRPFLLAALLLPAGPAALATTSVSETLTCPIGGGSFSYKAVASSFAAGERPDGKPYGTGPVPIPLPECPDNGLVLYKDYDSGEVAKLEPLIKSDAYRALLAGDTQYYRAYWLMREMGLPPERYLWALLQASWEAEGKPELRHRYLTELAEASAKVAPRPNDLNWIGMEGRSINALRELGRFDEAAARLARVPLQSLDMAMPTGAAATPDAISKVRTRRGWLTFFKALKPVIERKDSSLEPLDLLPRATALGRCLDKAESLDSADKAFCATESAAVEELRVSREKLAKEMEALRRSREAAGR